MLIAIACMGGRVAAMAGRTVAFGILLACLAYLYGEIVRPDRAWIFASKPGGGTIFGASMAMIFFGVPSALYAFTGHLPFAFRGEDPSSPSVDEWSDKDDVTPEGLPGHLGAKRGIVHCRVVAAWEVNDPDEAAVRLGLEGNGGLWPIEADPALRLTIKLLRFDQAYGGEMMSREEADRFLAWFLDAFGVSPNGLRFYTNSSEPVPNDEEPRIANSWMPLTSATFDRGIVVLGPSRIGCLWFEDED
ncbi:hypothetical protein EON79_17500 [bacterium]|nr:MAG: hypothetical protein EON79_17500 [bacterium]